MESVLKGLRRGLRNKRNIWSGLVNLLSPYCWRVPAQVIPSVLLHHPKPLSPPNAINYLYLKNTYYLNKQLIKKYSENVFKPAAIREIQIKTRIVPVKLSGGFKNYTI